MLFRGSKVDLHIQVDRLKLIETLKTNKETHVNTYKDSLKGYKVELVKHAESNLERAKAGKHPEHFPHRRPSNYEPQYTRAIKMLEMSEEKTVRLTAVDFARFVEDDWDWKEEFVATSTLYGSPN